MKLEYTVVHSDDKWLLGRLTMDLEMSGLELSDLSEPLYEDDYNWVAIYNNGVFCYHDHSCVGRPIRYELTESNYTEVLTKILGQ